MNFWLARSVAFANQENYLDELFAVYPTVPEGMRQIDPAVWAAVEESFAKKDNAALIRSALALDLFPVKDSYVAYLRRDTSAIARNPKTVARICGRLYEIWLNKIRERSSEAKETNRQIGQMFRNWLRKGSLGVVPVGTEEFAATKENAVLDAGDAEMKTFAAEHLGYAGGKGLDFVARFNGKYVIGEAKFLTDAGGHQNAQFNDSITTLCAKCRAETVAILDGVVYIKGESKMHREATVKHRRRNIMSALVLREFLYQL